MTNTERNYKKLCDLIHRIKPGATVDECDDLIIKAIKNDLRRTATK